MKRYSSIAPLVLVATASGCSRPEPTPPAVNELGDAGALPGDTSAVPEPGDGVAPTAPFVGVLAEEPIKASAGAPAWLGINAEVTESDGMRYLVAVGTVRGIRNVALARSSAENRARAQLSKWLGSPTLTGAEVIEVWQEPKGALVAARVRVPLPPEWTPPAGGPAPGDTP